MIPMKWICCTGMLVLGGVAGATTTGRSEVGVVMSRGNSDTETANAKIDIINERGSWRNTYGLAGLYGRSTEATIATRWNARAQTDRKFGRGAFWFVALAYDDDRFSGFDYQGTASVGFGRQFIDNERTKLQGQIGAGYRRLRPEVLLFDPNGFVIDRIPGEDDADAVANGALTWEHALTDSTKLLAAVGVEAGQSNTLSRGDFALQVKMTQLLAISVGLNVRSNSNPPVPLERTDTLTTLNLVYERK